MKHKNLKHCTCLSVSLLLCILIISCSKPGDVPSPEIPADPVIPVIPGVPFITTTPITAHTINTVTLGGHITDKGKDIILTRGLCYNTTGNPTIKDKVYQTLRTGDTIIFELLVYDLQPNTTYHIKAFASNSLGVGYGEEILFSTTPMDAAKTMYIGGNNSLYSISCEEKKLNWIQAMGGVVNSSPIYSKGYIYVGCMDGFLYAFDTSGVLKWKADTGGEIDRFSPVVSKGVVFINNETGVFAFDAISGIFKWKYATPNRLSISQSGVVVSDNLVFTSGINIEAIDEQTGKLKWSRDMLSLYLLPKVHNNKVYTVNGNTRKLNVLDATTGDVLWESFTGHHNAIGINLAYGNVYIQTDDNLIVMDTLTGKVKWSTIIGGGYPFTHQGGSSPAIFDSTVFLVDGVGQFYFYNAIDGSNKWTGGGAIIDGDVTPMNGFVAYGTNYVDPNIGSVYFVKLPYRGSWNSPLRASFRGTPCVVTKSGTVYRGGDVYP